MWSLVKLNRDFLYTVPVAGMATCASERAALGRCGGRWFVPLRHALQQVVQAPKAARQIA